MTINARKKGNTFEVRFCQMLRFFGFEAKTARAESKNLDDSGVDIFTNCPFNFQLKAVERMNQSYHDILENMPRDKTRIIVHKRNNKGSVVVMKLEDFQELHLEDNKLGQVYEGL